MKKLLLFIPVLFLGACTAPKEVGNKFPDKSKEIATSIATRLGLTFTDSILKNDNDNLTYILVKDNKIYHINCYLTNSFNDFKTRCFLYIQETEN